MNINQTHHGYGDNVAGNKVVNNYVNIPKLEYSLFTENKTPEGYSYEYDIDITPPAKSLDSLIGSIAIPSYLANIPMNISSSAMLKIPGGSSWVRLSFSTKNKISDDGNLFSIKQS